VANSPYNKVDAINGLNPEYHVFDHASAYSIIQSADVVLNPKSDLAFFKYKSNNKSLISWLLGLPVAETPEELLILMDYKERLQQVERMRPVVCRDYNINQSAEEYRNIIKAIKLNHFSSTYANE
jgi:hypothetical protein